MDRLTVTSPIDGSFLGEVGVTPSEEIRRRTARAGAVFDLWSRTPLHRRSELLRNLRRNVCLARADIAERITREQGKPLLEAIVAELLPVIDVLTYLARRLPRLLAPRPAPHHQPFFRHRRAYYRLRPTGVWAVISPWNYPFSIPTLQVATLLAAGNTVVLKPSPLTPLTAECILDLFRAAGFPDGVLEIVHGGAEQGAELVRDPHVRGVLFTGSLAGGRSVYAEAAASGIKKVVLETGGKDAALVLADAPLERAARGIAWASMMNAGQTCASVERVYVEEPAAARFEELLARELRALRLGNPLEETTDVGPLTARFQLEKVEAHVAEARSRGARIVTGGRARPDLGELYYEPTLVTAAPEELSIVREETFGPVVVLEAVGSAEEALERANSAAYALTASIWTRGRRRARALAEGLRAGAVTVNSHLTSYGEANSAWGCLLPSGLGRTHGEFGFLECLDVTYIDEGYSERPEIQWYPYGRRLRGLLDDFLALLGEVSWRRRALRLARLTPRLAYLARHVPLPPLLGGLPRYL